MEKPVADLIAERVQKDPKVRAVVEDARVFAELQEQRGWKRLRDRIKADKDKYMAGIAARLMKGTKVSPEELAFHRGFYAGAEWIIGHPEQAMKALDSAARVAYLLIETEMIQEQESDSPYA